MDQLLNYIRPEGALYEVESSFTIPNGGNLAAQIEVRKQRGDIQSIGLCVSAEGLTEDDLLNAKITLQNNGVSIVENVNLLRFSTAYRLGAQVIIPIYIKAGSVLGVQAVNPGGTDILITVNQFFYDPNNNFNFVGGKNVGLGC